MKKTLVNKSVSLTDRDLERIGGVFDKTLDTRLTKALDERFTPLVVAVTHIKDKLDNEMVTKIEFAKFRSENTAHIDGFIKLHQTLDQELVSLRHKYERLEDRLKTVEEKVGIK